jgi:hypothetical protein
MFFGLIMAEWDFLGVEKQGSIVFVIFSVKRFIPTTLKIDARVQKQVVSDPDTCMLSS